MITILSKVTQKLSLSNLSKIVSLQVVLALLAYGFDASGCSEEGLKEFPPSMYPFLKTDGNGKFILVTGTRTVALESIGSQEVLKRLKNSNGTLTNVVVQGDLELAELFASEKRDSISFENVVIQGGDISFTREDPAKFLSQQTTSYNFRFKNVIVQGTIDLKELSIQSFQLLNSEVQDSVNLSDTTVMNKLAIQDTKIAGAIAIGQGPFNDLFSLQKVCIGSQCVPTANPSKSGFYANEAIFDGETRFVKFHLCSEFGANFNEAIFQSSITPLFQKINWTLGNFTKSIFSHGAEFQGVYLSDPSLITYFEGVNLSGPFTVTDIKSKSPISFNNATASDRFIIREGQIGQLSLFGAVFKDLFYLKELYLSEGICMVNSVFYSSAIISGGGWVYPSIPQTRGVQTCPQGEGTPPSEEDISYHSDLAWATFLRGLTIQNVKIQGNLSLANAYATEIDLASSEIQGLTNLLLYGLDAKEFQVNWNQIEKALSLPPKCSSHPSASNNGESINKSAMWQETVRIIKNLVSQFEERNWLSDKNGAQFVLNQSQGELDLCKNKIMDASLNYLHQVLTGYELRPVRTLYWYLVLSYLFTLSYTLLGSFRLADVSTETRSSSKFALKLFKIPVKFDKNETYQQTDEWTGVYTGIALAFPVGTDAIYTTPRRWILALGYVHWALRLAFLALIVQQLSNTVPLLHSLVKTLI